MTCTHELDSRLGSLTVCMRESPDDCVWLSHERLHHSRVGLRHRDLRRQGPGRKGDCGQSVSFATCRESEQLTLAL
jgi:hypothetical protein